MKKAFTLIELLVVIGIIAVLMALSFAAFGKSRYSANSQICITNLKQLATGIHAYLADYKDLPDAYVLEQPNQSVSLSGKLQNHLDAPRPVRNKKVKPWACPFDTAYYTYAGGSYYYNPTYYREHFAIPPVTIYENTPRLYFMQDGLARPNGKLHISRFDGSAAEVGQANYPFQEFAWLEQYRRIN